MPIASFETNLTDAQWNLFAALLPPPKRLGRPPTSPRLLCAAILYLVKAGCQWRLLPKSFPPWKTVHDRFRKWCRDGTWQLLNDALRSVVRCEECKQHAPSTAVLDSQTVRSDGQGGAVGYDAGKKTKGHKRFILVDTLGLLLGVAIAPADTPERAGARVLLEAVLPQLASLRRLWVDGGYSGPEFATWVRERAPRLGVEVIKRTDAAQGFQVLPKRWVVERTFGWVMRHRRLVRDYERTESSAGGWLFVALIRIMLGRLA